MKNIIKYLIVFICGISVQLFGQDRTIDSLKVKLGQTNNDSIKCQLLSTLSEIISDDNVWPIYNDQLYKMSKSKIMSGTHKSLFYEKAFIAASNNKGYLLDLKGKTDSSIIYFTECLELSKKINDKANYAESLYNIGKAKSLIGDIPKALEFYANSLTIAEKENLNELTARILSSSGLIHHKQKDLTKAFECYERAYKIQLKIKDKRGCAYSLTNTAGVYLDKKDYSNALKCFTESKILFEEIKDYSGYLVALRNIAKIFIVNKDFNNAIDICNQIINNNKASLYKPLLSRTNEMLAAIYITLKENDKALKHSLLAMKIAKETENPELIRNGAQLLKQIYKINGNYELSLHNYELYIQMRDSLFSQETRKASIRSQLKYEYEKKAAADSVKVAEEKKITTLQLKQEENQRYFLYGGLGLTLVFGVFMFNRFRITKKQKNIIEDQKTIVEEQKNVVEAKQKEIMDSIRYAKRIQQSLLPSEKYLERIFKNRN